MVRVLLVLVWVVLMVRIFDEGVFGEGQQYDAIGHVNRIVALIFFQGDDSTTAASRTGGTRCMVRCRRR